MADGEGVFDAPPAPSRRGDMVLVSFGVRHADNATASNGVVASCSSRELDTRNRGFLGDLGHGLLTVHRTRERSLNDFGFS